jgi:uncharacterized membrane protein YqaE (UPF0057 family)
MKSVLLFILAFLLLSTTPLTTMAAVVVPATTATEPDPAKVKSAMDDFNSLSRKEKKTRVKEVKKEIKAYKAAKKAGKEADTDTLLLVILAILLPPLAVYLYEGEINNRFWISLILTLLGWLPGVIYALVVILGQH